MKRPLGLTLFCLALCAQAGYAWADGNDGKQGGTAVSASGASALASNGSISTNGNPPASTNNAPGSTSSGPSPASEAQSAYEAICAKERLRCTLTYDDQPKPVEKPAAPPKPETVNSPPIKGPLAIALVLAVLALAVLLWLRFGNGGVLLSQTPQELKPQRVQAPDAWETQWAEAGSQSDTLLARLMAMPDRRQALIHLLRYCLLHAADISDTRLARSDTERTVFARLPATLPLRQDLKSLLDETEWVNYGGRDPAEDRVQALFAAARGLLSSVRMTAHDMHKAGA